MRLIGKRVGVGGIDPRHALLGGVLAVVGHVSVVEPDVERPGSGRGLPVGELRAQVRVFQPPRGQRVGVEQQEEPVIEELGVLDVERDLLLDPFALRSDREPAQGGLTFLARAEEAQVHRPQLGHRLRPERSAGHSRAQEARRRQGHADVSGLDFLDDLVFGARVRRRDELLRLELARGVEIDGHVELGADRAQDPEIEDLVQIEIEASHDLPQELGAQVRVLGGA